MTAVVDDKDSYWIKTLVAGKYKSKNDEATLVKHNKTTDKVEEYHWLVGPERSATYSRPGDKYTAEIVDGEDQYFKWLTGSFNAPDFFQNAVLDSSLCHIHKNGTVVDHWLVGPERAPVYLRADNNFTMQVLDGNNTCQKWLRGSFKAPEFFQTTNALGASHYSLRTYNETDKSTVDQWLVGGGRHVKFKSNDGNPFTVRFNEQNNWLAVKGSLNAPFVTVTNGQPSYICNEKQFFLHGDLPKFPNSVSLANVDALMFRYDPRSSSKGFALQVDGGTRVWAEGIFKDAVIHREARGDPPSLLHENGAQVWLDGFLVSGDVSAAYWRRAGKDGGEMPTEILGNGLELYTRGRYLDVDLLGHHTIDEKALVLYFAAGDAKLAVKPPPARVTFITHLASFQLGGTCYLNTILNIFTCTPCFRSFFVQQLAEVAARPPVCAYDKHVFAYFYALLCAKDAVMSPVTETNMVARLEKQLLLRSHIKSTRGGYCSNAFVTLLTVFNVAFTTDVWHPGTALVAPTPAAQVHFVLAPSLEHLPEYLPATDSTRFVLIAAALSGGEHAPKLPDREHHAVAALRDSNGNANIVLDSNGKIWDLPWKPKLHADAAATIDMDIVEVGGVYVPESFSKTSRYRCGNMRAFTSMPPPADKVACSSRSAAIAKSIKTLRELWQDTQMALMSANDGSLE